MISTSVLADPVLAASAPAACILQRFWTTGQLRLVYEATLALVGKEKVWVAWVEAVVGIWSWEIQVCRPAYSVMNAHTIE